MANGFDFENLLARSAYNTKQDFDKAYAKGKRIADNTGRTLIDWGKKGKRKLGQLADRAEKLGGDLLDSLGDD